MGKNKGPSKVEVGVKAGAKFDGINGANATISDNKASANAHDTVPATTTTSAYTIPTDAEVGSPVTRTNTGTTERAHRELPVPIHRIPGLYFETGDVQILVSPDLT